MQSLPQLPDFLGKTDMLTSPTRYPEGKKTQSSSSDSAFEFLRVDQNSKIIQNCTLNITKIASDAANVDSDGSLLDEMESGSRLFRADSSESGFSLEFPYQRTNDQVRTQYIDRLISLKVLKKEHMKPHQTLFVFDWDDTLLPTSYLCYVGIEKITPEIERKLMLLDQCASKLLAKAVRAGKVYIVTNAQEKWVETSSRSYLPLTNRIISEGNITVVSARAEYEEMYPRDPKKWKAESFLDIGETLDAQVPTNIVCFGDSEIEIEAAANMTKLFKQVIVKTVKLKPCPNPEELIKELNVILQKFEQIYTTLRNLTIKLEKKSL